MRFELIIDSENEGCRTREQVLELAREAVDRARLAGYGSKHAIMDENGNKVGHYSISEEDEEVV